MAWRILLVCGLVLVLVAPPAAAQSTRTKILRECSRDGRLTGDYTSQQIRDARSNIPDDIDEYTDCRDVLTRALLSRAGGDSNSGGATNTGGGTGGDLGGAGAPPGGDGSGPLLTPSTDADREALDTAGGATRTPVEISGSSVTPGSAGTLRNDLPTTLIVLLALLGAAALAAIAPFARRRATAPLRALGPAIRRVIPGRS